MPIAAEALRKMGVYDKRKLMGVTTLDVVRALGLPRAADVPRTAAQLYTLVFNSLQHSRSASAV